MGSAAVVVLGGRPERSNEMPLAVDRRSVFWGQRWTNDLLVVAGADLHQGLFIEKLLIGRRQTEGPGYLPALTKEPFYTRGSEEQEKARFLRIDPEPVRNVPGAIDERASHRFDHSLTVLDPNLPREDHEELVLIPVDVEWRCESLASSQLHHREAGRVPRVGVTARRP